MPIYMDFRMPCSCPCYYLQRAKVPHKCPVCDGTGLVSKPPGIAGDQPTWSRNDASPYPCKACDGTGILRNNMSICIDFRVHRDCPLYHYTYRKDAKTPHKCPVCDGTGLVSKPPGIAGDQPTWSSNDASPYPCKACDGTGILWG